MLPPMPPHAWVHIDLAALRNNIQAVREFVGSDVDVMAVVKANGYGHGLVQTARAALEGGAACLGVATVEEGLRLREKGIAKPVIVLGAALPEAAEQTVHADLSQTVSSVQAVRALQSAARHLGRQAKVHIKLDTGLGRVGVYPDEVTDILDAVQSGAHIILEGIATHVGWALGLQQEALSTQIRFFAAEMDAIRPKLTSLPRWTHAANSLVTVAEPLGHFNLVRVGLLTYGIPPTTHDVFHCPPLGRLAPVLSIHARLTQIRSLRAGQPVSYGGTQTVTRTTTAAIVPVGYGDGYPRYSEGGGHILLNGERCPILGTVCMDQMIVDITGRPASIGTEVVLIGQSGSATITANDLAHTAGRTPYEMVTGLGARLPFTYSPADFQ